MREASTAMPNAVVNERTSTRVRIARGATTRAAPVGQVRFDGCTGRTPSETTQLAGVWLLARGPPGPRETTARTGPHEVEGVWISHRVSPEFGWAACAGPGLQFTWRLGEGGKATAQTVGGRIYVDRGLHGGPR